MMNPIFNVSVANMLFSSLRPLLSPQAAGDLTSPLPAIGSGASDTPPVPATSYVPGSGKDYMVGPGREKLSRTASHTRATSKPFQTGARP